MFFHISSKNPVDADISNRKHYSAPAGAVTMLFCQRVNATHLAYIHILIYIHLLFWLGGICIIIFQKKQKGLFDGFDFASSKGGSIDGIRPVLVA